MSQLKCHITKKILKKESLHRADFIRKEIFSLIQKDYPDFNEHSYISTDELNRYRKLYLSRLIASETEDLSKLEKEVLDAISTHQILSENIEDEVEKKLTFSERLADIIADFGGSWMFISLFFIFVIFWMAINIWTLATKPFDPYPFILLNLILSCLAAIQAPIIMMSQNRLEEKDRKRGEHDFKINLKAELEIKLLNDKMDHLISQQNKKLLEIQELQTDYLEDILEKLKKNHPSTG